jgi:hypothetical protein
MLEESAKVVTSTTELLEAIKSPLMDEMNVKIILET